MGFSQIELDNLLSITSNNYLKDATIDEKHEKFNVIDPFPEISSSLLNSKDIIKYILTTGMLSPFNPEKLKGATYTCTFSGKYLKYNDNKECDTYSLLDGEELIIEPNSITYLEISTDFRIPSYLILRFNLQVQNVYKGLLLGTGPIVDPGFVGKLYIPLHNLTSNLYVIQKDAELISVEFTKLSVKDDWIINKSSKLYTDIVKKLDFSTLPKEIQKNISPNRDITEYIKKALQGNDKFHKEPKNILCVGSSMVETISDFKSLKNDVEESRKSVNKSLDEAKKRDRVLTQLSIISIVALLLTSVSLAGTAWSYFNNNNRLSEAINQIETLNSTIDSISTELTQLKIENREKQIDSLTKEYNLLDDKSKNEAIELKNEIDRINEEIENLKKQLP